MTPHLPAAFMSASQIARLREHLHYELEHHPNWPDLWNLQGLLHAVRGDFEKARNAFMVALGRNAAYATARWNLNWVHLLAKSSDAEPGVAEVKGGLQPIGLFPIVRNLLREVGPDPEWLPRDPSLAFAGLGIAAANGNRQTFDRILASLRSKDAGIDSLLSEAGLSKSENDLGLFAEFGRPEWLNPGLAELLERGARLEAMAGRDQDALRLFALAALYRGERAALLVEKSEILGRTGKGDQILSLLTEAVDLSPEWYRARLALGYELSLRGMLSEALVHMEKAVRLKPGYPDVQYQYGLLLHASDRTGETIEALKTALETNPQYLVARIALANLMFESGREADALPHFERVLEEGFESAALKGRFGYAMHAAGFRNRAEEIFLEAIAQDSERAEVLALYGQFLSETDRKMEARTVWERALSTDPSPDVRDRIEEMMGDISVNE